MPKKLIMAGSIQNVRIVTLLLIILYFSQAKCEDESRYNLQALPSSDLEYANQNNDELSSTSDQQLPSSPSSSLSQSTSGIWANPVGVLNTPPYRVFNNIFAKPSFIDWIVDQKLRFLAQQNYLDADDVYQLYVHIYIVKSDLTAAEIYNTVEQIVNAIYRYREKHGLLPDRAPFDIGRQTTSQNSNLQSSKPTTDTTDLTFSNIHSLSAQRDYSSNVLSYIVDEFIEEYTNLYQMLNYIYPQTPRSLHEDIKSILYQLGSQYDSEIYGTLLVRIDSNVRFLLTDLIKYVPQTPYLY